MIPTLTVMMPVYNAQPYLEAAVQSILSQTLKNIRLLIIDDGSTDGSGAVLTRLSRQEPRIELIRRENRGQIATRNELLERATTDIVACADADDISLPDRLERQIAVFQRDPELLVLGCQMQVIDEGGNVVGEMRKPLGADNVALALNRGTVISQPSCMMRRREILASGGYRPAYEHAEDYDCFLRACERGKVDNAGFVGIQYRVHGDSVSHRYAIRQLASADLARATHALRITGNEDPTDAFANAPAFDHPVMRKLVPAAPLYRALSRIGTRKGSGALRVILAAPVGRRQQRHVQRALVGEFIRRPFDAASVRLLYRAASLGPGRMFRAYYRMALQDRRSTQRWSVLPAKSGLAQPSPGA